MNSGKQDMFIIEPPESLSKPLIVPVKTLTGPGPSNCSERVLRSLGHQTLGHLHQEFCQIMDDIKDGVRYIFQTKNRLTLVLSAAGHGGMEAALTNLVEANENVLIVKSGIWGERAADMASRLNAKVRVLETKLGEPFEFDHLEKALIKYKPSVVFVCHSESSTGMKQPLRGIGPLVHKYNGLLIVDGVASIGAEPFFTDAWEIDVVYTGSQKVLGAPPGLTPITFGPRAEKKIFQRKTKMVSFYWDMTILGNYWNCFGMPRVYHHTMSATLLYGLREALAQISDETLQASWVRHSQASYRLRRGLELLGIRCFVNDPRYLLSTVTPILLPEGVKGTDISSYAMKKYKVEISAGLGPTTGKIMRIGLLGINATSATVDLILKVLEDSLRHVKKSHI